jgi:aminoglycoside 3-N-acetyltransferase I
MAATCVKRLSAAETELALSLFAMMGSVFGEALVRPDQNYARGLLEREDFWAFAALEDERPVAGLTAFVLPLTRSSKSELFVYDVAVLPTHQRRGVGRRLVEAAIRLARQSGIGVTWVAADDADKHALDFYRAIGGAASPVTVFTFAT